MRRLQFTIPQNIDGNNIIDSVYYCNDEILLNEHAYLKDKTRNFINYMVNAKMKDIKAYTIEFKRIPYIKELVVIVREKEEDGIFIPDFIKYREIGVNYLDI